ncbi:MAG: type IV secretory system conjugative DNA transfer family protein, partial [Peptococcaceae bacterium]|nr:type IV secretory system conjugative DNA transfer family protein [Peptococcaceae bacterium]
MTEVAIPYKEMFEHSIILGAPGAGKSASLFIPNLFRLAERLAAGYEIPNVVVTDPKGELLRLTGPYFRQAGARVWVFHPLDPTVSMAVNVIKHADTWEIADRIAWTIVKNTGTSAAEPFFDNTARLLLAMIILHCRITYAEANMNHVHALGTLVPASEMENFLCSSPNQMLRMQAAGFYARIKRNERLLGSIEGNLPPRLNLWNLDSVRAVTGCNEIDFFDFYTKDEKHNRPTILYVINPLERKDQLAPLMATFFTEFFLATVEVAKRQP